MFDEWLSPLDALPLDFEGLSPDLVVHVILGVIKLLFFEGLADEVGKASDQNYQQEHHAEEAGALKFLPLGWRLFKGFCGLLRDILVRILDDVNLIATLVVFYIVLWAFLKLINVGSIFLGDTNLDEMLVVFVGCGGIKYNVVVLDYLISHVPSVLLYFRWLEDS